MSEATIAEAGAPQPALRTLTKQDVELAVKQGWADFTQAPKYGLFFGGTYALGGLLTLYVAYALGLTFLIFPLIAGFALIGPFAAIGVYEVSRLREAGQAPSWNAVLGAVWSKAGRDIAILGVILFFVLAIWLKAAAVTYALFFGLRVLALPDLLQIALTSGNGIVFLLIGNAIGAIFALFAFSISVISFPLLVDRDVDFVTAMITSVRTVAANPKVMIGWGILIALLLAAASLPLFLGLAIALPVLGHASWHLYRRAVSA